MSEVFADTGYWAALQDSRDRLHVRALALTRAIEPLRILTTEMVLVEVLNMFGSRGEQQRSLALEVVARAERSPDVEIVPQTAAQFRAAVERDAERPDQTWSPHGLRQLHGHGRARNHRRARPRPRLRTGWLHGPAPPKPVNILHASTDPDPSTRLPAMLDPAPLRAAWNDGG